MNYQALYRKYRPKSFADFIDQDNIKKILVNSILNDKISHAYLFSGPRGIGKTSMAKIFAKAINCENFKDRYDVCDNCDNCNECNSQSVDIIEIDAASNNGVDQIRELKNKISIVPSKLKYKVYIIDEVHMLSNSAFNALLKTLEEPPAHVVFILATTEFYEVPETIVSRCQCFSFSRITMDSLINRLKYIADLEKIDITDQAIKEIAHYSNGGLRDAIGMLDKVHSFTNEKIDENVFKSINGMISQEDIEKFYKDILQEKLEESLKIINKVEEQGYDFKYFVERVMLFTRDNIISYYTDSKKIVGTVKDNIELVEKMNDALNNLKNALDPIVVVQIFILKYFESRKNISQEIKISENNELNEAKENRKIISQEINDVKTENKNINLNNVVDSTKNEKKCKNGQISGNFSVNLAIKGIRVNNSMATANINYKREVEKIWGNLPKNFMDDKYGRIAQLLADTVPMVVGSENIILTTLSEGIMDNIYKNLDAVEKYLAKIYKVLKVVVLTNTEFEDVKRKYIEDKKNNIVYHIQEECGKLIEEENNLINQAIDIFGSDMVEIE